MQESDSKMAMCRAVLKDALGRTEGCPSLAQIERYHGGGLAQPGQLAVREHLTSCAACRTELEMLTEFERGEARPEEADAIRSIEARLRQRTWGAAKAPPRLAWWQRWFGPWPSRNLSLAFALLLVVVAGVILRRDRAPELIPDPGGPEVMRSGTIEGLGPLGDVKQVPGSLRWQPVAGAATYTVRVMEIDRTELWKTETQTAGIELPAVFRLKIQPGKTLLWEVTARDASARVVAFSGLQGFRFTQE